MNKKSKKQTGAKAQAGMLIAIGSRGTALVNLKADELKALKLNAYNSQLAKLRLTDEQMAAYQAGRNSGVLWVDSASWLATKSEQFWIGSLDVALKQKLVKRAMAHVKQDGKEMALEVYVRAGWDSAKKFDHAIATKEGVNGRIEARLVGDKRNIKYVRHIGKLELVK